MSEYDERYPEYDSYFEGPDVKLFRREAEAEKRALHVIDKLLGTIKPEDGKIALFTFEERQQWGLRRNARRTVEDDSE